VLYVLKAFVLGGSAAQSDKQRYASRKKKTFVKPAVPRDYTAQEVASHNSLNDCWLIIDGQFHAKLRKSFFFFFFFFFFFSSFGFDFFVCVRCRQGLRCDVLCERSSRRRQHCQKGGTRQLGGLSRAAARRHQRAVNPGGLSRGPAEEAMNETNDGNSDTDIENQSSSTSSYHHHHHHHHYSQHILFFL
jgi:hypothetical protein